MTQKKRRLLLGLVLCAGAACVILAVWLHFRSKPLIEPSLNWQVYWVVYQVDGEPMEVTGYDQSALLSALSDSQVRPTRTQVGATHWPEVELSVWMTAADDPSVYRHIFFTGEDSYVEGLGERNYAFLNSEEVKAALIAALTPYVEDPANLQPAFFS